MDAVCLCVDTMSAYLMKRTRFIKEIVFVPAPHWRTRSPLVVVAEAIYWDSPDCLVAYKYGRHFLVWLALIRLVALHLSRLTCQPDNCLYMWLLAKISLKMHFSISLWMEKNQPCYLNYDSEKLTLKHAVGIWVIFPFKPSKGGMVRIRSTCDICDLTEALRPHYLISPLHLYCFSHRLKPFGRNF